MSLKHTVEEIRLKNGAKGLIIDVPNTTVVLYDIFFRAGTLYAPKNIRQVAHVMEHMAFGANERFDSLEEFSREFKKNGAYSNAWTSSNSMIYRAYAPLMEWDRILELEGLSVARPKFMSDNLRSEKGNVKEELIGYANSYSRVLWQEVMKKAGVNRWYDPDELKTVDRITLDGIRSFHKNTHTSRNMNFILAGDLKSHHNKAMELLESWRLPEGRQLPIKKEKFIPIGPVHVSRADLANLNFHLQFSLNRTLERQEMTELTSLNHILTGTYHSRIWGKARSRGICYEVGSYFYTGSTGVSEWVISGQVSEENANKLFDLIVKELMNVTSGYLTKAEVDEAKGFRLGSLQMSGQTVADLASWYSDIYFDSNTIDHMDDMPLRIEKTSVISMAKLAREFIKDGMLHFGVIGNTKASKTSQLYEKLKTIKTGSK